MQSAEQITKALEAAGFRAAFLPISAMEQVSEHYESLERRAPAAGTAKAVVERFHNQQPPKLDFEPKSILVTAIPCAGAMLVLSRKSRRFEIPVLPAYIHVAPSIKRQDVLLAATQYQFEQVRGVSVKLLAALSGLGQYGRNNICYVGDWGSYTWLETHYTDVPFDGPVRPVQRMAACENCGLCRAVCPTGAIGNCDVIDANRCLAMQNEDRKRMPRWVPKDAHHALSGCVRCQECCPQNPPIDFSRTLELDKAEARQLLSREKKLPKPLKAKLEEFGCEKWTMSVIKRNARLAVKAKEI